MTLSDRIALQTKANGSKLVRIPADELLELMKKAESGRHGQARRRRLLSGAERTSQGRPHRPCDHREQRAEGQGVMIADNFEYYADLIKRIRLQHGLDDDLGTSSSSIDHVVLSNHSRANDHLTIADAHRLIGILQAETQSRAIHAECEDVMARLSKMVGP